MNDDVKLADLMVECLTELAQRDDEAAGRELLRQIEAEEPGTLAASVARLERRRLRATLH